MNMFTSIPVQKPKKAKFNLSHSKKGSCEFNELIPVMAREVLPGDNWQQDSGLMLRAAPMVSPVMHEVDVKLYSFFVPYRLVWDEFKDYITKGRLGQSNPVHPFVTWNSANNYAFQVGHLADYLGVQAKDNAGVGPVTNPVNISALPFRVYQLIYNEYFFNDNLEATPVPFSKGSGDSNADLAELEQKRVRQWEADRYVSALPFAQRGDTVIMPVDIEFEYRHPAVAYNGIGTDLSAGPLTLGAGTGTGNPITDDLNTEATIDNIESIEGTSLDINEFREALALQKWLENNARGGSKYIDQLLVRWGVRSSDARLQRPEYLGGASAPLVISEVLSTAQFENESTIVPQGNMAGHGIAVGNSNGFKRFFEEHGMVMTLMCIIPRTGYMQGIDKMFTRLDSMEWANPEFANLGEEEIKVRELYHDPNGVAGQGDTLFGYTPRFSDYKYAPSTVHGEFRTTLKHWTLVREFENEPTLSQEFVQANADNRIFAVDGGANHFYYQVKHRISVFRSLPYYGVPGKMTV